MNKKHNLQPHQLFSMTKPLPPFLSSPVPGVAAKGSPVSPAECCCGRALPGNWPVAVDTQLPARKNGRKEGVSAMLETPDDSNTRNTSPGLVKVNFILI